MTPALVRADVPPPDDYVEECTEARAEQRTGNDCQLCEGAYYGDPDACVQQFEGTAYTKECKSWGASVWNEVWCDPNTVSDTPAEPGNEPGCGCHARGGIASAVALLSLFGLLGLGIARRRSA